MLIEWLIIDGYNLLHETEELARLMKTDLHLARNKLVRLVEAAALDMAPQTTIVFDGRESGIDESLTVKHLEVYFSPSNLSADTIIERLVCRFPNPGKILVVTSDHAERVTVSSAGAQTMSSFEFMAQCKTMARKPARNTNPPGREPRLGDLFPDLS